MIRSGTILWATVICFAAAGCADEEFAAGDPRQIEDKISEKELESFLRVVEVLPEPKLAMFPAIFLAPPQWTTSRTLPVKDLVKEEETLLHERSTPTALIKHMPNSRFVQRILRHERMTDEQFVSLYVALGLAMSRAHIPAEFDFDATLARGNRALAALRKDGTIFSSLKEDVAYSVQESAAWISLMNRLQKLRQVPRENIELVAAHRQKLAALFPSEFARNPLGEFAKVLQDTGVPFDEPAGHDSDEFLPWSREQAVVGSNGNSSEASARAAPALSRP